MGKSDLVSLGRITKPQGLKGSFRVRALGIESENLTHLDRIFIKPSNGDLLECNVQSTQSRKGFFVVQVEQISHIDQVKSLVGGEVFALRSDMAELEEGDFYWFELVGLKVVTSDGRDLGEVRSIIPTGANDVLQVRLGDKEILIPYIDDVIASVDLEAGVITVDPLPGMLD